jgi:anti-sigma factor RsiW
MSEHHGPIGEADLHGYVDGRLSPARRELVESHLAENPALQQRLQDWQTQAESLRRLLRADDAMERDVILARLTGRRARSRAWRHRMRGAALAASVVLALLAGGLGGWLLHGQRSPTEIARLGLEAAAAYRTFANDPAHAIEVSSDNRAEMVTWMTQRLGRRITVPDLAPLGFHLMGGRVLSAMYGPAALLVYRDAADDRITVYVQPMRIGAPAEMRPMQTQAVDGFAWIARQIGYTVMSDGSLSRLQSVADRVRADTLS